ncbi:branched-chain amino acid ABC transporter, ATP-binding protein [Agrilactobacillus composti DSM 18527 = JCM 14202]|uniref:Branched-chain amino acid ABC transporter, ATP-binding protein n=1 Tax=Agrilactobacillus composti DSM 18527 = JCM 14202 TaxID=1423734 RepID=X0PCI6_9LACO|nr:urea ABC transporter ATP-binding protein UrtD [Agrilactobacillus composti]KRM30582.1 branched-chain amino acid ABC transporter, ATP-binding protein [Agrilactobacillus composti DSM 18527 = JCM 14202]GAF38344.1 urea ABC transporter, ATPase protein UrtD [Agrilactobacillus composti DSM 18527 = JCM 14202]
MLLKPQKKTNPQAGAKPILNLKDISISFGNFQAIKNVSTTVYENEIRCFIGPNGAGKTTILDAICGKSPITSGQITYYEGQRSLNIEKMRDYDISRQGIARKFQAPSIFNALTIWENVSLAVAKEYSVWQALTSHFTTAQKTRIQEILHLIGLEALQDQYPALLSHGQKQWLEIGILLAAKPRLLLLDEPVAGMGRNETERTEALLLKLKENCTIICVEHDMQFVQDIADNITVFHEGQVLDEGSFERIQNNPKVIAVYLGRNED